jgi:hypothetical protein
MRENDYREIVALIQRELEEIGLPEIASILLHRDGELSSVDSRYMAIIMLKEFEAHLATIDKATYQGSMRAIKECLSSDVERKGRAPRDAIVETTPEERAIRGAPSIISLSNLPRLTALRKSLRSLASELSRTEGDEPSRQRVQ